MDEKVSINTSDLEDIVSRAIRNEMMDLFGFEDEKEARKLMRQMGDSARKASEFWDEMYSQGKKNLVRTIYAALAFLFFAGIGWIAYHLGIPGIDKVLK